MFGFNELDKIINPINKLFSKDYLEGEELIYTENRANKKLKFYYYIPALIMANRDANYPVLFCVPGLGGRGKTFVNNTIKHYAEREGFIIIAPSFNFDDNDWKEKISYQYPAVWSGAAAINMIESIKSKGLKTDLLYLLGHSAGAQFVLRFSLLHPGLCKACTAHAGGSSILPEKLNSIKYLVTVGQHDAVHRIQYAREFCCQAQAMGIYALYKEYPIGHFFSSDQLNDSLNFLSAVKHNIINT